MHNVEQQGLQRTVYRVEKPKARLVLAHGAGAGNQHAFMVDFAKGMANNGIEVISINFPYMQMVYELDKKRPPNTNKILLQHFIDEIELAGDALPLFIAGKSMGGRVASQVLADADFSSKLLAGIVLGYPFIPPGKPEKLSQRTEHFKALNKPLYILQGERDTFGGVELLSQLPLPSEITLDWIKSGDHSFKPLKSSGLTSEDNIDAAVSKAVGFINSYVK